MKSFVIGGAGFIGSHLVDQLVLRGPVTVYDNLSVGRWDRVALDARRVLGDVLDLPRLTEAMHGHDVVFHLAANPEARWGLKEPRLDLHQGTIATFNALEAARETRTKKFVFASSGTVYGNTSDPCRETDLGSLPISLYGASKLAGEALLASYVECFGLTGYILRFGNVVGSRATHGAILDFCRGLREHPDSLQVLGDGTQRKPYLHVSDCVAGILHVLDRASDNPAVYNLAPEDWTNVRYIAARVVATSPNPSARIVYGSSPQGWRGDVPKSRLDPGKLASLGFRVRHTSADAVDRAVQEIVSEVFIT